MAEEQIYPKGLPPQTEKFAAENELKEWLFSTVVDSIDRITEKLFNEKGFQKREDFAGVYGNDSTYGHGVKNGEYNVKYSTKTKTYIDKVLTLGAKRINSIINMDLDKEAKILNLSYKTTENSAFRGFQSPEKGFLNNLTTTISVSSREDFKKILNKILKTAIQREIGFLTSTKLGIEDKVDKSTASTVESGNDDNQNMRQMKLAELFNQEPESIKNIFEAKKEEFPKEIKKKNTIPLGDGKYLMFDREKELEEGEFKNFFEKTLKRFFGASSIDELNQEEKKMFFALIDSGWESKEEVMDEITSSGAGAGVAALGSLGTAGAFGFLAPAMFKKTKENEKFFQTPYAKNKTKKPSIEKSKKEGDSFWTTVELNKGSGYVPKGMEHNYIMGMHSMNVQENTEAQAKDSLLKRKFVVNEENESLGINKRYIITAKLNEEEEKEKIKKLALFESNSSIRQAENVIEECSCGCESCEEDSSVYRDEYEQEFDMDFESRNQDLEHGEDFMGKKIIIIQKPGTEVSYKVYEGDFLNENRLYIFDFLTGNYVENPNHKKNSDVNEKKYIAEVQKRKEKGYSISSLSDSEEQINLKSHKKESKFPWQY